MKITLIGAGNVASHMAERLFSAGCIISQVYSRTIDSASRLAQRVNATAINDISRISEESDFYIFAVKDSILEDLIAQIPHSNGVWIHTAGSMPLSIFADKVKHYGVIYPLQTFSKSKAIEWNNIPLFIEYSDKESQKGIECISKKLSDKIYPLSTEQRKYIHLSGVFACNFVNHMYELANKIVNRVDLPFEILLPLIDETCNKVHSLSPQEAQTGPAIRFDENVMNKHLSLLESEKEKELYRRISQSIYDSHKD